MLRYFIHPHIKKLCKHGKLICENHLPYTVRKSWDPCQKETDQRRDSCFYFSLNTFFLSFRSKSLLHHGYPSWTLCLASSYISVCIISPTEMWGKKVIFLLSLPLISFVILE